MTDSDRDRRADAVTDRARDDWHYPRPSRTLPLTLDMPEGETATSLCSRLSAVNGLSRMRGMCRDFLISHVALCNGDPDAVVRVAELAGADPGALRFQTPRLIEPGWFQLGRERIKFNAMLRNGGQLCPLCVANDECRDPRFGPYQRDIWQVAAFRRCLQHGVAFERPQFACRPSEAHDFLQILKTWAPELITPVEAGDTSLEEYLLARITKGPGADWIDNQSFHVVWRFAEALGLLLIRGANVKLHEQDTPALIRAGAAGFAVLRAGPDALERVLAVIMAHAGPDRNNYGKLYAPILTCLLERRRDPAFDEIRLFVRSFILRNFRVPPDTSILGKQSRGNHVFTALTASQHYDVPISLLNRQLRLEGLRADNRPNHSSDPTLLIPRARMEDIIAKVRKLSSITVARSVLGADRYVMERLRAAGLLVPHFADDGGMPMYHQDQIMAFLKRLQDAVTGIRKPSRYWRPITSAAARTHCSTAWILGQVFGGRLELAARLPNPFQLADFVVPMNSLKALLHLQPEGMVTVAEAAKWLAVDVRTIHALAVSGYMSSQMVDSRLANRPNRLIAKADLEVFAHHYIVLRALNGTRKAQYTETLVFIEQQGVQPLLMREGTKPIFKRSVIDRLSRLPGGEQLARLLTVENTRLAKFADRASEPTQHDAEEGES